MPLYPLKSFPLIIRRLLLIVTLSLGGVVRLCAQVQDGPYMTWDDFVLDYWDNQKAADDTEGDTEKLEQLEDLAHHPLQLNRCTREDMQQFSFLDEAQIDSLFSYRERKRGFVSLGELQMVKGMDYFTRCRLSLFVRCDSAYPPSAAFLQHMEEANRLGKKMIKGRHELETRLDMPLYRRAGYNVPDAPSKTNYYIGNALHHVMRFRYAYKREVMYGLTMEKDGGEPVGKRGFYPYDYLSGYVLLRPKGRAWSMAVGDYNVWSGNGLLLGRRIYSGREVEARQTRNTSSLFKAHTSTEEIDFFRGAVGAWKWRSMDVMAFASYRRLDGRLSNASSDTVTTLLQTGLHRTLSEIETRRTVGCFTAGWHWGWNQKHWGVATDGVWSHFSKYVAPTERWYNAHYFRGQTARSLSASYYIELSRLSIQGDVATDREWHVSTVQRLLYAPTRHLRFGMQYRQFSPRYVSLYGKALQQASRVANEQGVLLNAYALIGKSVEWSGYVDLFRFPHPTYQSRQPNAKGMEAMCQLAYRLSNNWRLLMRYKLKSRQYTLTLEEQQGLEYRTVQKLRLSSVWTRARYELTAQADACYAHRQSGKHSLGWMISSRAAWKASSRWGLKAFGALFFTDDTESMLYAYEPQMLHASAFPSFAYHGMRGVVMGHYQVLKGLTLSLRLASIHYFNRDHISSRLDEISSSWKNDLSLQVRWVM